MKPWIVILTLLVALGLVNSAIYQKEQLLKNGETVFLKLAPVDPRSLMQGDYMALHFELADDIQAAVKASVANHTDISEPLTLDGKVQVMLNQQRIAKFVSIKDNEFTSNASQLSLQFRVRHGQVKFASNAYFFEEGSGQDLEAAEFGEFKVNSDGELLLVSLRDKSLKQVGQSALR